MGQLFRAFADLVKDLDLVLEAHNHLYFQFGEIRIVFWISWTPMDFMGTQMSRFMTSRHTYKNIKQIKIKFKNTLSKAKLVIHYVKYKDEVLV